MKFDSPLVTVLSQTPVTALSGLVNVISSPVELIAVITLKFGSVPVPF